MRSTLFLRAQYGTQSDGQAGVQPWQQRPSYENYKSPYGPQYRIGRHFQGLNALRASRYGVMGSLFGVSAGIFAIFFFNAVPRVREDILEPLPIIGEYFHKETPPEDDPF